MAQRQSDHRPDLRHPQVVFCIGLGADSRAGVRKPLNDRKHAQAVADTVAQAGLVQSTGCDRADRV